MEGIEIEGAEGTWRLKTGRRRDQKNTSNTQKSGQRFGLTRLEETSLEGWVIAIEMQGHIPEMDVHFKYSDHSFLAAKDIKPGRPLSLF